MALIKSAKSLFIKVSIVELLLMSYVCLFFRLIMAVILRQVVSAFTIQVQFTALEPYRAGNMPLIRISIS